MGIVHTFQIIDIHVQRAFMSSNITVINYMQWCNLKLELINFDSSNLSLLQNVVKQNSQWTFFHGNDTSKMNFLYSTLLHYFDVTSKLNCL